jgi:hypothetical protein
MSHRHHSTPTGNGNAHISINLSSRPSSRTASRNSSKTPPPLALPDDFSDWDDDDEMDGRRPPLHRPIDGRSHQPLLHKDSHDEERGRSQDSTERPPLFTRRSTMRSRSPDTQAKLATRKKYTYAAFFLGLSLVSFVIQTETAVYIQHELGWNKAYCMLYVSLFPSPLPISLFYKEGKLRAYKTAT